MMRTLLAAIILVAVSGAGRATALLPEELLAASAKHVPANLQRQAEVLAASSRSVAAMGAFDTEVYGEGFGRFDGYYNGRFMEAGLIRPFRSMGGKLYGSYRNSRGDFPVYEDEYYSSTGGTLKIGALLPLLRDRQIDARRVGILDARQAIREAEMQALLTRVDVQRQALRTYWEWAASGHTLNVYESLLKLAKDRDVGMRKQVRDGSLAAIFLTENAQNIARRESLLLEAQRRFQTAALALSFYLRTSEGQMREPEAGQLPSLDVLAKLPRASTFSDTLSVVDRRPELRRLDAAIVRAEQQIRLSGNELLPSLDLKLEYGYGLGSAGEGGPSRASEEAVIGINLSVPLERRTAKGRLSRARAEREALLQRKRQAQEQIVLEIRRILVDLDAARRQVDLAEKEMKQAQRMRDAEVQRFRQGASNFFVVNLREKSEADARIRYLDSLKAAHQARSDYDAVTVNEQRLGLSSGSG